LWLWSQDDQPVRAGPAVAQPVEAGLIGVTMDVDAQRKMMGSLVVEAAASAAE